MARYILKRVLYMLITLFIIASATFFLMKFLPGTPFSAQEKLSATQKAAIIAHYGLDKPLMVQYWNYIVNLMQFDLGTSYQFQGQSVTALIMARISPSIQLGIQALVFGTVIGIILGCVAAIFQNTWADTTSTFIAIVGKSIPSFVFAALLQYFIAVKLGLLPVAFWNGPEYTILPTIALMMFPLAIAARYMRTELIDVLGSDYILLAKAKGNSAPAVAFKHAIRNALIPLITVLGPLAVGLMTGSMVIEQIYAIPGIGEQFVKAIQLNDYSVIMGTTLLYSALLVSVILITDILYGIIDPRIRLGGNKA
ncbi:MULTISPECIES: oligopeptide ABC transporter permease [Brochothrix]|uniref:ABC transporter permease n=1 Tax=Brochothrix thermosphacta TaxID=2756 RepID=A0A1D2K328_BROTH|nr:MULTISPECIES: oligopeptide ABC transporter permease [Brochothrix]SLM94539.1 Oligopeptide transport system permease protein OppB (TC 3.A.1.5.1) [Brachybacterium faecium]ANZ95495.1 peptide ABC transporter permease [Brochothrix thermosphacta]ANZ96231.1 peptide ABC transporter permease [Brochothrix thermosphacta]ATF25639.1 ABC transporter permease [Brochothrix thermosphacta]ATH84983.1 ABC transporter permease [Brochothrix thermosphacta]